MPDRDLDEKNRLTLDLPETLAGRLKLAAATQNRRAADVVTALLDRHLPRPEARETTGKKGQIPYA